MESNGDLRVRKERKSLASDVERALEGRREEEEEAEVDRRARAVVQVRVQTESSSPAPISAEDVPQGSGIAATEKEDRLSSPHRDNPEDVKMHNKVIHLESSTPQVSPSPPSALPESTPTSSALPPASFQLPRPSLDQPEPRPETEIEADWSLIIPEDPNNGPASDDESDPEPDLGCLFDFQDSEME